MLQLKIRAAKVDVIKVLPPGSEVRGIVKDDIDRAVAALRAMITPGSNLHVIEIGFLTRQGGGRKR